MYPQYDDYDGSEELSYENEWLGEQEQVIEGMECSMPFVNLNPDENIIVLKVSDNEFTEMLSALYWGAMFSYPEKYLQVVSYLLRAVHCPPVMAEQECFEYPTYAGFFRYLPMNPYITPDEIPEGYATQPFIVNGENGNDVPSYEHYDVIVPSAAITFDINWWSSISGQLPTVEIIVDGAGKMFIKMLTLPQGGLAVITVDNPPDLLDILAGIVTSADNIIDLNQDLVSLPPETAQELIFPLDIVGTGLHTIYVVFLPILDDSLTPIRFGGGFRGVQLCDFVGSTDMGVTSLRFEDCNLEMQVNGAWEVIPGWENWLDCVPSGGGGGGTAALKTTTYRKGLGASDFTTTSTTLVGVTGSVQEHTTVYPTVVIKTYNIAISNSGANDCEARGQIQGQTADSVANARMTGTSRMEMTSVAIYNDLPAGTYDLEMVARSLSAGTTTIERDSQIVYVVEEYASAEELFVTAVRISGNELQYQKAGAWITASDSLATILAAIQATANNALSVASGAVSVNNTQNTQITSIIGVNTAQQTTIDSHTSTLANHESRLESIETIDIPQINLNIANHETRIDNLEAVTSVLAFGGIWAWEHDLTAINGGYVLGTAGTGWTSGQGWVSNANGLTILYDGELLYQNQISHIQCEVIYTSAPTGDSSWRVNDGDLGSFRYAGVGQISRGWYRLPNKSNVQLKIGLTGSGAFRLVTLRYLGRGTDVPFD